MDTVPVIMAIDPGSSSGAIATRLGDTIELWNMPETPYDMLKLFWHYNNRVVGRVVEAPDHIVTTLSNIMAVCEDVGTTRPGNSARSAHTFAVHRGHIEMGLLATGIPVTWVRPQYWMKQLFGTYPSGPDNFKARKDFIYRKMQERWPAVPFTKRQADALGILTYYLNRQNNKEEATA